MLKAYQKEENKMGENPYNEIVEMGKNVEKSNSGEINSNFGEINLDGTNGISENASSGVDTSFRISQNKLPEKTCIWKKIKNALFYEIKVELTPREQKMEDDINKFLHQEVTWQSFKNFLFQEVPITYKGKRIF